MKCARTDASRLLPVDVWECIRSRLSSADDLASLSNCKRAWREEWGLHAPSLRGGRLVRSDIPLAARCYWEQYRLKTCGISFGDVEGNLSLLIRKPSFGSVFPYCTVHCMHEASCRSCMPHAPVDAVVEDLPAASGTGMYV